MAQITINRTQAANKWKTRIQGSVEDMRRGIEAVQTAPTELAAQASDAYLAGVQRAVETGRFQNGCRRVTLAQWRDAAINKGLARVGSGAEAAVGKMEAFYGELFPFEENLMAQIDEMPNVTIDHSIARAAAWIRGMANFQRSA